SAISPHSQSASASRAPSASTALASLREWMSAPRAGQDMANGASPRRRNTAGHEDNERSEDGLSTTTNNSGNSSSANRPRGASSGALGAAHNVISTTPKKAGGGLSLLGGLRNPMVALKASSDGDGSSNRTGSSEGGASEGGASPSDENEARMRLLAKCEGAKQRLLQINMERERDLEEFIAMADKVEAAGGRDTPHLARIRQHYDRKNKKSTGLIDAVQKKLAGYEARLADLDGGGSGAAPDPLRGHTVLQGIRRTGANLKQMTSSVVSAPLELAQKLKRGTMGSSSDPIENDLLGQSQFYPSAVQLQQQQAQSSRSASGLSSGLLLGGLTAASSGAPSTSTSNNKPKAATLPANMRMSPVDLEAAANAAIANTMVPSSSSSVTTSSVEWPKRGGGGGERGRKGPDEEKDKEKEPAEDSLARLPPLGTVLAEKRAFARGDGGEERGGGGSDYGAPYVMAPRTSLTGGSSVTTADEISAMFGEMKQLRQHNVVIVEHMDKLQDKVQHELARQEARLLEERFKYQRLEDTLNEFIELHQAETGTLKHELQLIASRIDYQYNDRFKKVEENLESTQNHMFRVENSLRSSLEVKAGGPWFNVVFLSGATILLELLKIGLYLTSVVLDFFRPFTGTRTKTGCFLFVLFLGFMLLQNIGSIVGLFYSGDGGGAQVNATTAPSANLSSILNATHSAVAAAAGSGQAPPPPPAAPPS
ncbi:hypothetical protein PRIPAC_75359, partial [Pristionchus pacificus]